MSNALDMKEFQTQLQHLDRLVQGTEHLADPAVQAHFRDTVRVLLELHTAGLTRLLSHVETAGPVGRQILEVCGQDEVVSGLLLLHGLHSLNLEARVQQALSDVRPQLHAHGGDVELLEVSEQLVRLRLHGSCDGCPSSSVTMKQTIEEAILARAPDVLAVEVEGVVEAGAPPTDSARLALPLLQGTP
jgi:Fe-S cluster biogenesis protein NfuA